MGCNTSKESVQPVEGEDKTEEKTEDKVVGEPATTEEKKEEGKQEEKQQEEEDSAKDSSSKPASGSTLKAVTPTSESARSGERLSNHLAATTPEPPPCDEDELNAAEDTEEVAAAATKIQAAFRGHQTRRTMKQVQQPQQEPEPTREQLEAEFRADDAELCKAATTIQNSFRNHLKAKEGGEGGKEGEGSAAGKQENKQVTGTALGLFEMCLKTGLPDLETSRRQNSPWEEEEELDIDLTDPDLHKAATKIQASFRGHKVRKETDPVPGVPANH